MRDPKFAVVLIAVALIGASAFSLYRFLGKNPPRPGGVACTTEALLCPDGSTVGRSGPQCAFAACPSSGSPIVGTLKTDGTNYSLVFNAPTDTPGGVAYSMPLVFKPGTAATGLVGKNVRVYGSFTEGATFAAEKIEALSGTAADPSLGEARVGETVFVNGVRITLNRITEDSRCPASVYCIQAGRLVADVSLRSDTDRETATIASDASPLAFDSFHISIAGIEPQKSANQTIDASQYLITFKVTSNLR